MKYNVTVNGETFEVVVDRADGSVRTVSRQASESSYVSRPVVKQPDVPAAPISAPTPSPVPAQAPAPSPASQQAVKSNGSDSEVTCPMPGSVWKIVANVGDSIQAGQPIIIIEAMKMEIEVTATVSGVVEKICVSVGQAVNTGDVVAIIS